MSGGITVGFLQRLRLYFALFENSSVVVDNNKSIRVMATQPPTFRQQAGMLTSPFMSFECITSII